MPSVEQPLPDERPARRSDGLIVAVFTATMVLSAALLFLVQPMVTQFVLPRLGGTPTVWTTSQLFFQVMLLLGYVYAHASIRYLGPRRQALVHAGLILLPLVVLPLAAGGGDPPENVAPALWLVGVLLASVGAPFLAVSATAPLVQRWLAALDHPRADDPYFLYRASNVGSVIGLFGYPLVLQPTLGLRAQGQAWSIGYGVLVMALAVCVAIVWRTASPVRPQAAATPVSSAPTRGRIAGWVLLAAIPSSLSLGTTTHLSTDIAPFPLLWVLPLAVYLLTFVLAFGSTPRVQRAVRWSRRALVPAVLLTLVMTSLANLVATTVPYALVWQIGVSLATLLVVGMACHGRLAAARPSADRLTGFYIWVSIGGALGGLFNAVGAPILFDTTTEYPLLLAVALLVVCPLPSGVLRRPGSLALGAVGIAGLVLLFARPELLPVLVLLVASFFLAQQLTRRAPRMATTLLMLVVAGTLVVVARLSPDTRLADRDFFGSVQVSDRGDQRVYVQGTTVHGVQNQTPSLRLVPSSYYHPTGPIGDIVREARRTGRTKQVAITGLGAGTLACEGQRGERWRFFEIAPLSIEIASDPRQFTYLRDCPPTASIVRGDARIEYRKTPGRYGLAIMDAFSSDAIPLHLLTREAVQLWFSRLSADGLVTYHISNRHLDLEPVLGDLASDLRLTCRIRVDPELDDARGRPIPGKAPSVWVVLGRSEAALGGLASSVPGWRACRRSNRRVWTDDYSNVVSIIVPDTRQ